MMRSLYSGVTGLRNHQTRMDVIGNNIANVNTVGFKASRVTFNDIYSETIRSGSATNEVHGGQNPMQIGLGMGVSSIDVMHGRSAAMLTSMPLDVSIAGDGFFTVSTVPDGSQVYYTRAGNFSLDAPIQEEGAARQNNIARLLDANGNVVMGYMLQEGRAYTDATASPDSVAVPAPPIPDYPVPNAQLVPISIDFDSFDNVSIDASGAIVGRVKPPNGTGVNNLDQADNWAGRSNGANAEWVNEKVVLGWVCISTFSNPTGLQKEGNNLYSQSPASGPAMQHIAGSDETNAGVLNPGTLEMSNVDIAAQFTDMIVTQRGFQANSRIITVSDQMLEELVNIKR